MAAGSSHLLLDCGFSLRELQRRLRQIGLEAGDLDAVFITHEHQDHCRGIHQLCKRFRLPVYLTSGTMAGLREVVPQPVIIRSGDVIDIGGVSVRPICVAHDANEPVQFRFDASGVRLGVLTDLGSFDQSVIAHYDGCHGLLLEANYDPEMLYQGPYPWFLKRRVAGPLGHLGNDQTLKLLESIDISSLQRLVIGHISAVNNCHDKLRELFDEARSERAVQLRGRVELACQQTGCGWLQLTHPNHFTTESL